MKQNHFMIALIAFFALIALIDGQAAVDSRGEINVKGSDQGLVPASSVVTLITTLTIDRSLAEPNEEIKTIEIRLPSGFIVEPLDLQSVSRDGQRIDATAETTTNSLRIVLDRAIDDLSNSIYEIIFNSRTPNVTKEATFRVRLRNRDDLPIGDFIRPGNVDALPNNNDFTLQVIPNVPPEAVREFTVETDLTGENDVTIRWQQSEDLDVNGYFIYRDADPPIDINDPTETVFRDVDVTPGNHSYAIEAYKTPLLRSDRSEAITVTVSQDTTPPAPPERFTVIGSGDGVRLMWDSSPTRDVETYKLFFGTLGESLTPLIDIDGSAVEIAAEAPNEFIDRRPLRLGVFTYAIEAVDEAGNRSEKISDILRILDEPFPNPFTPLSDNPNFNRIVFPARAIQGAEGEFIVLIFDMNGVLVKALGPDLDKSELEWDGTDESGDLVESGVYVYQLQLGESFKTGTVIVAK
ncbi:MAG: hypothetical protein O7E52_19415 [Candidatus Poribacteria bacterium]|nr:hypothetical protein [Candidatus Poribacteria bacterium]